MTISSMTRVLTAIGEKKFKSALLDFGGPQRIRNTTTTASIRASQSKNNHATSSWHSPSAAKTARMKQVSSAVKEGRCSTSIRVAPELSFFVVVRFESTKGN